MPIKFHPVVFNLEESMEDLLISPDSASTEALSPEELPIPEKVERPEMPDAQIREGDSRSCEGPWPALPSVCPTAEHKRELLLPESYQEGGGRTTLSHSPFSRPPPHSSPEMCFISST